MRLRRLLSVLGSVIGLLVAALAVWIAWTYFVSTLPVDAQGELPEPAVARSNGPPNIVLIVADDLGYGGLSSYGGTLYQTPNIDALAASGVRYTNAHVSASVCSPSRAGLLTGRNQVSFGYEYNPGDQQDEVSKGFGIPTDIPILPERLKAAGYATSALGKWHLGGAPGMRPQERGFDEFFGVLEGAFNYFSVAPEGAVWSRTFRFINGPDRKATPFWRGKRKVRVDEYVTDRLTYEGRSFIRRNADKPFFLYLAYNAPHSPFEAPAKYLDRFPYLSGDERTFAAMMAALDDGVGAIVGDLKELGLDDNTIVVFMSDNGCPNYPIQDGRYVCSNAPLAGFKASLFEGGLRIPLIISGSGFEPSVNGAPVSALDLSPTLLAIAGAGKNFSSDGIDLRDPSTLAERTLYWRSGQSIAMLDDGFKLHLAERGAPNAVNTAGDNPIARIRRKLSGEEARIKQRTLAVYDPAQPPAWGHYAMLYDLKSDVGESRNLTKVDQVRANRMKAELDRWNATLPTRPLWGSDLDAISVHDGVNLLRH